MELISKQEADVLAHTSNTGRYVTGEAHVIALAKRGLLQDHGAQRLAGGDHYFTLTGKGRSALARWREDQPKEPEVKLTRSQLRYRRYLEGRDVFGSFKRFLKHEKEVSPWPC